MHVCSERPLHLNRPTQIFTVEEILEPVKRCDILHLASRDLWKFPMKPCLTRSACVMLLGIAATFTCRADSLASSASSAASDSVGSLSDSINRSSNSSSGNKKVADGDYQVLEAAALPERPGLMRVRLRTQAAASQGELAEFLLDLPQRTLDQSGLVAGDIVSVHNRPYGLEFARAQTREPFFLVLADDWHNDLNARAVTP
jgi:hypothetical protein